MSGRVRGVRGIAGVFFAIALLVAAPAWAADNEKVAVFVERDIVSGDFDTGSDIAKLRRQGLKDFYASRRYKPVWSRDSGPKGKAKALFGELRTSVVHGLSPEFYEIGKIAALMKSREPEDLARLDMLMTGALVDFVHDLINGRMAGDRDSKWNAVPPRLFSPAELVDGAAKAGNLRKYVLSVIGEDRRYVRLIAKLTDLQRLPTSSFWPKGKIADKPVKMGGKSKSIIAIRNKLALLGDLALEEMNGSMVLNKALSDGIKNYQQRHGAEPTGVVDAALIKLLNRPITSRATQIKINLDRRRWQNRALAERSLYLNMADGSLKVSVKDKTAGLLAVNVDPIHREVPTQFAQLTGLAAAPGGGIELQVSGTNIERGFVVSKRSLESNLAGLKRVLSAPDGAKLEAVLAGAEATTFNEPVEFYITYLTAWATRDGRANYRPDVFERDPQIAERLGLKGL